MEPTTKSNNLDFYEIRIKSPKKSLIEIFPDYQIEEEFHDLMVRGGAFYAVWDEKKKMWNRNERSVKRIVDQDVNIKSSEEEKKADSATQTTSAAMRIPMEPVMVNQSSFRQQTSAR